MDTMTETIATAQHDYLIDLGATPEQIAGLTKAAASTMIDDLKARRARTESIATLESQTDGPLRVIDFRVEIIERDEPLPATRRAKKLGMSLTHEARLIRPEGCPRVTIMANTVEIDGTTYRLAGMPSDYAGDGGETVPVPADSSLAEDIAIALREAR